MQEHIELLDQYQRRGGMHDRGHKIHQSRSWEGIRSGVMKRFGGKRGKSVGLHEEEYEEAGGSANGEKDSVSGQVGSSDKTTEDSSQIYTEKISVWPYTCWTPRRGHKSAVSHVLARLIDTIKALT